MTLLKFFSAVLRDTRGATQDGRAPPVHVDEASGAALLHVRRGDLVCLAAAGGHPSTRPVAALAIFRLLHGLMDLWAAAVGAGAGPGGEGGGGPAEASDAGRPGARGKEAAGHSADGLCAAAVVRRFLACHELLDEALENGLPQATDPGVLSALVGGLDPGLKGMLSRLTGRRRRETQEKADHARLQVTGAVGHRREGVKHRVNELYLDIVERRVHSSVHPFVRSSMQISLFLSTHQSILSSLPPSLQGRHPVAPRPGCPACHGARQHRVSMLFEWHARSPPWARGGASGAGIGRRGQRQEGRGRRRRQRQ